MNPYQPSLLTANVGSHPLTKHQLGADAERLQHVLRAHMLLPGTVPTGRRLMLCSHFNQYELQPTLGSGRARMRWAISGCRLRLALRAGGFPWVPESWE